MWDVTASTGRRRLFAEVQLVPRYLGEFFRPEVLTGVVGIREEIQAGGSDGRTRLGPRRRHAARGRCPGRGAAAYLSPYATTVRPVPTKTRPSHTVGVTNAWVVPRASAPPDA